MDQERIEQEDGKPGRMGRKTLNPSRLPVSLFLSLGAT
jgi:hypothetical protein